MNSRRTPQRARYGLRKPYVAVSIANTPERAATGVFWPLTDTYRRWVSSAARRGESCPACGWYTNPAGCCRKACRLYSGVPF